MSFYFDSCVIDEIEKKKNRLDEEKRQDDKLKKAITNELDWIQSTSKAQQSKSAGRLNRYEEMLESSTKERAAQTTSIFIPAGPRLGQLVIDGSGIRKVVSTFIY